MANKPLFHNQRGATHIVAVLVVIIVAVVGFAGYAVMHGGSKKDVAKIPVAPKSTAPAVFTSKADAQQAVKALDNDKLDQNLDTTALDSDIDALL